MLSFWIFICSHDYVYSKYRSILLCSKIRSFERSLDLWMLTFILSGRSLILVILRHLYYISLERCKLLRHLPWRVEWGCRLITRFSGILDIPLSITSKIVAYWFFFVQISGDQGNAIWNCEGVQVGGLGSSFGILGSWTTIFHDIDDPVGEESHECQCLQTPTHKVSLWK